MDQPLEHQFRLVELAEEIVAGSYNVAAELVADALVDSILERSKRV